MPKKFPSKAFLNIFTVITDNKTLSVNVEVDLKKCESRSAYCGNDKNDNFLYQKAIFTDSYVPEWMQGNMECLDFFHRKDTFFNVACFSISFTMFLL